MYINKAIIYGNLTRDPELKSLPSGAPVCEFGVATNRVWKDKNGTKQESVDYHNIVVFSKQAEIIKQYLHKGSSIFLEGRIQNRSWDAPDGTKKYRSEIVVERFQFGPKGGSTSGSYEKKSPSDSTKAPMDKEEGSPSIEYPEEEINSEDIPF
ncbi:MAG: single-stranded DNA-binding protein [Candidatus Zambryskibacteria bacterium]|nr:single-stranded DNA-binding protein [Candidatus Zambryskibacteria bacterium]